MPIYIKTLLEVKQGTGTTLVLKENYNFWRAQEWQTMNATSDIYFVHCKCHRDKDIRHSLTKEHEKNYEE